MDSFGTPLNEAWGRAQHRMSAPLPQFTELTCCDLSFRSSSSKRCVRCSNPAHLIWTSHGEPKAVCLDCLLSPTRKAECSICAEEREHCQETRVNDMVVYICAPCLYNTAMYVQAMQHADEDAEEDTNDSEDESDSTASEPSDQDKAETPDSADSLESARTISVWSNIRTWFEHFRGSF